MKFREIRLSDGTDKLTSESAPKIMLLTIELDENFIDIESITVTLVTALQSLSIPWTKLDAP